MDLVKKLKGYQTMSPPLKASLWYTVCNVLLKGMALLATPIFTRIMTQDQYGSYSIFMSWYNILFIAATLNLNLSSYNKGLINYKEQVNAFTSSQLGLCMALTTLLLIVYLLFREFFTQILGMTPLLMAAMFGLLYTTPATEFWAAWERYNFKYKKFVVITISTTVLSIVIGLLAVISTEQKTEAKVFSETLVRALIGLAIFIVLMSRGKCVFKWEYWKYGLLFNLPLIPHYLSTYVLNQADRIMIGNMAGNSQAAMYSVAYTISTMTMLVVSGVNNSLVPYIYKSIHTGEQGNIKKNTAPLFALMAGMCILVMCFAPEVILVFAGKAYMDAIWVIPPITASVYFIFVYSMYSTIEYYYQKTGRVAVASCVAAGANIVLNYVCIKLFGYHAAGYTTLACYILLALMHYIFYRGVVRKELPENKDLYDLRTILLFSGLLLLVMIAMVLTYRWALIRYGIVSVLAVVALLNRKRIMGMLKLKNL